MVLRFSTLKGGSDKDFSGWYWILRISERQRKKPRSMAGLFLEVVLHNDDTTYKEHSEEVSSIPLQFTLSIEEDQIDGRW